MTMARILVVDDKRLFREGLKRTLSCRSLVVTAEASSFVQALKLLQSTEKIVDLVVGDPAPDLYREFEALRAILQQFPTMKAVILAERLTAECSALALRSGAASVLTHDISSEALKHTLGLVLAGKHAIPTLVAHTSGAPQISSSEGGDDTSELLATLSNLESRDRGSPTAVTSGRVDGVRSHLTDDILESRADLLATLSGRESQILDCLVRGLPNKLIARQLEMAEATVKVHLKALLRKLNVQNRTQAAILAVRRKLEPPAAPNAGSNQDAELGPEAKNDTRKNRVTIQPLPPRTHFRPAPQRWTAQCPPQERIAGR